MVSCKSTAEEVSFEWSHHRIWSTDSKVRTTLHVSIIDPSSLHTNNKFILKVSLLGGANLLDVVQQTLGQEFGLSPTMNWSSILKI